TRIPIVLILGVVPGIAFAQAIPSATPVAEARSSAPVTDSAQNSGTAQSSQPPFSPASTPASSASPSDAPALAPASDSPDAAPLPGPDSPAAQGQGVRSSTPVGPSQSGEPAVDQHIVQTFFHDEYHMWTGPFHPGNYDSHSMKKYGIPFLLISGA